MGRIERALVCLNGHVINHRSETEPQHNQKRCAKCGEETISQCPSCNAIIKGFYIPKDVFFENLHSIPIGAYCDECGKPYPWTEKKIQAAKELIDLTNELDDKEKEILKGSIDDITTDNPRNEVAATKIKLILKKVGSATKDVLVSTISSVAAETAKKFLLG